MGYKTYGAISAFIVALSTPVPALAQAAPSRPVPNQEPAGDEGADTPSPDASSEIVVTAQKRSENVQRVPISVVALSAEALSNANVESIVDLPRIAPSLIISRGANPTNQRITIRGLGAGSSSAVEPSVAIFLDGVYVPRAGSVIGNLTDIQAVEVLRGPQGTLFGRNASVGAISFKSADPTFQRSASATLIAGNYGRLRNEIVLNLPLSDTLAIRLVESAERTTGDFVSLSPYPHKQGRNDSQFGRASLLWKPSDNLTWKIKGDYQHSGGDGQVPWELFEATVRPGNTFSSRLDPDGPGPLSGPVLSTGPVNDRVVSNYLVSTVNDRVWGVTSDLAYDVGDYTVRLVNGYRDWDSRPIDSDALQLPVPLVARNQYFRSKSQSHELQLISPERALFNGALDFVGGLYFYRETYALGNSIDLLGSYCRPFIQNALPTRLAACLAGPQIAAGTDDFDQTTKSKAAYLQGNIHLADALTVTLGGRYTDDEKRGRIVQVRNNGAELFHTNENTSLALAENRFTWRAGVQLQANPDTMLFTSVSTGFKSGGFNSSMSTSVLGQLRNFAAESVTNYEAGIRSRLLGRKLTANATLFRTDIEGFQDRGFDGLIFTVRNVGALRQQGVEFDFTLNPTRQLSLGVAGTYLDSKFLDFRGAPNLPGFSGTQDLTGTPMNFSPKWQGNAFAQWDGDIGNEWRLLARGDVRYTSTTNIGSETNANPATVEPRYALLSARLQLSSPGDRFRLALFGDNLSNHNYCVLRLGQSGDTLFGLRDSVTGGTAIRCLVGSPRRYGIEFRMNLR